MNCKLNFTNLKEYTVAQVSKQKTVKRKGDKKPHRFTAKQKDDGMVVFPMANGKLATTWVSNVDNILSEGTGSLDLERLKTLKEKLTNTMSLVEHRISELEIEKAEKAAKEFVEHKIKYVLKNCIGRPAKVCFGNGQFSMYSVLTYVEVEGDKLHIKGIYPLPMQRDSKAYPCYMHSGVAQIEYKAPLKSLQFKTMSSDDHFIMSSTAVSTTIEFGGTFEHAYTDMVKVYLTEITEQFHAITAKPKKAKLVLKKYTPKAKTESK